MKERNWLTWLTVLSLVVGFVAMGTRLWLSYEAVRVSRAKDKVDEELYVTQKQSQAMEASLKRQNSKLLQANSSLKSANNQLKNSNAGLKNAAQNLPEKGEAAGMDLWHTAKPTGKKYRKFVNAAKKKGRQTLFVKVDNETGQAEHNLLILAIPSASEVTLGNLTSFFPVNGAKPQYAYIKEVPAGSSTTYLNLTNSNVSLAFFFENSQGNYWFKGSRGRLDKVGSYSHFAKTLSQIGLNAGKLKVAKIKKQ